MRLDHAEPGVRERVWPLLDTAFARLSERAAIAAAVGADWHAVSVPFVALEGAEAVAHAGVIPIPMVVAGERRTVAGVHAVCTRPDRRGRGHARRVLEEALAYVDAHFTAAVLTTEIPALYEPFGFRVVPEVVFRPRVVAPPRAGEPLRPLRLREPDDRALAWRLLGERAPVSSALAAVDPGWLFLLDEALASWGFARLHYAPDLDVMVAFDVRGGTLRLLDVVGREVPPLATLLARVPAGWGSVELWFTPDRARAGPCDTRPADPTDLLMARGDLPLAGELMLSPLARC